MELTSAQWALLLGLVARAASEEAARVTRMEARPPGSHTPDKLQAARLLRDDLAGLEEAVKEAGRDASLQLVDPELAQPWAGGEGKWAESEPEEPYQPCGPDCTGEEGCPGCEALASYYEAMEAEHEKLMALGSFKGHQAAALDAECDRCGQVRDVLYEQTACTLGYPGHPGAEWTAFQVCQGCLS